MDHDQRMKSAVESFAEELVRFAVPEWYPRFGFAKVDWKDKEVLPDPPEGERRDIDLLARVGVKEAAEGSESLLLHVEIDSGESLTRLRRMMPRYHNYLYGVPVLSIGLYLGVGLDGRGWDEAEEDLWTKNLGATTRPYLGLPGLDALSYVADDNLLAVAFTALMNVREDRMPWLEANAMKGRTTWFVGVKFKRRDRRAGPRRRAGAARGRRRAARCRLGSPRAVARWPQLPLGTRTSPSPSLGSLASRSIPSGCSSPAIPPFGPRRTSSFLGASADSSGFATTLATLVSDSDSFGSPTSSCLFFISWITFATSSFHTRPIHLW